MGETSISQTDVQCNHNAQNGNFDCLTLARLRLFTASNVWGSVGPLSRRSPPDLVRALRKNKRVALNERKPMIPILRSQVNRWPQRSDQTLAAGRLTRLSSGCYQVDRNEEIGAKLSLNTS